MSNALLNARRTDTAFVCDRCASDAKAIGQWGVGSVGTDSICQWCSSAITQVVYTGQVMEPYVGQHGQMTCSTNLALEPARRFIWDVNGYYRELGVDPHCSKAELREAYQAQGLDDDRLTYIAKVLLNDETRIQYDLLPIGQLWLDPLLTAVIRERILEDIEGTPITEEDLETQTMRKDLLAREGHPVDLSPHDEPWRPSGYGHYCYKVGPRDWLMVRWRSLLAQAATELNLHTKDLMVGVMRHAEPVGVYDLRDGRQIVFLEEHAFATIELARAAMVLAGSHGTHPSTPLSTPLHP
jgi:hypothetical protein